MITSCLWSLAPQLACDPQVPQFSGIQMSTLCTIHALFTRPGSGLVKKQELGNLIIPLRAKRGSKSKAVIFFRQSMETQNCNLTKDYLTFHLTNRKKIRTIGCQSCFCKLVFLQKQLIYYFLAGNNYPD